MKSIKLKFTAVFTTTILVVVLSFSILIYVSNIVNDDGPLATEEIERLVRFNPRLRDYIERTTNIEDIRELGEVLRNDQRQEYTRTVFLLLIPTVAMSAIFAYVASSYLVRPIEDLAHNISLIESTNLSKRLSTKSDSEEIEILVDSFNDLLDELEQSFQTQDRFIQDAAHELRTPLAAMKTNIQIFRETESNSKLGDYKKMVDIFEKLSNKLIKINENLLFINRQSKSEYEFEEVDINNLIEEVLDSLQTKIQEKGIKLELSLDNSTSKVNVDIQRMTYVLKNLFENGVKYNKQGGELKISTRNYKDSIQIIVEDEGIGIPKKEISHIFERFYRSSNAIDSLEEGEGLGLSIVSEVVAMHKGEIKVESEKNKGTKFIIILPKK